MRHAYLIMAHKNWAQLRLLLNMLDDQRNDIYLHIDAKSDAFEPSILTDATAYSEIHLVPRISVNWGGSSQIDCEISLLREATKSHHDYYHLLSGADLPLHSIDHIDDFFDKHQGMEFVQFTSIASASQHPDRERLSLYHPWMNVDNQNLLLKILEIGSKTTQKILHIDRLRGKNIVLGKGANWFSITHDFAQYVLSVYPQWKHIFERSFCADELFLQTILLNSQFKDKIYYKSADDNDKAIMRLIDWHRGKPYVYRIGDLDLLEESPMLFARKFDEKIDNEIIKALHTHITK